MKKQNILLLLISLLLCIGISGISFAWYQSLQSDFGKASVEGIIRASYFESGDGTSLNKWPGSGSQEGYAYEIKYPEQLYNLAWLQYLGYFNSDDNVKEGVLETTYFYLSDNLDMTGYVLPPIGTANNPFIGNFDGNGKTISNLTIANTVKNDTGLEMATEDEPDVSGVEIIGLFGVVGQYNDSVKYTYDSATNEVKNLTINNLTLNSQTDQCLIGIVAGYVNGNVSNVGVVNSNMNIKSGTAILDNTNLSSGYSDTSLFGYIEEPFRNAIKETVILGEITADESGGEESDTERGTINMLEIYKRVSYIFGAKYEGFNKLNAYNLYLYGGSINNTYNLNDYPVSYYEDSYNSTGNKYVNYFLNSPSYLPISIDKSTLELDEDKAKDYNKKISKDYVVTNKYYRENSTEAILPHNAGYITGFGPQDSTSGTRISFKPAEWLDTYSSGDKEMYGYINGSWQAITDQNSSETTRYQNYWSNAFPTLFGDGESAGSLFWQAGDHYYTPSLSFERSGTNTATSSFSSPGAQIDGVTVSKLIANGVEFKLGKDGVLTVAMAANYSTGNGQNGAEFYYINDYDGSNPTAVRIDKVYTDSLNKAYYIIQNQNDTYEGNSAYTLKYDREWMWGWNGKKVYYFEIPISVEEHTVYYITNSKGASSNSSSFASFVYLDIAPNGGAGIDIGGAQGALSMTETVYTHKVNDGANFIASGALSIGDDVPCAEYKITATDLYNFSRTDNNLVITSDSEESPEYIAKDITVTTSGNSYTQSDLVINDPSLWIEGETKKWTIVYMNDGTYKLYLDKEEVAPEDLEEYQYIVKKFNDYLADHPFT